MLPAREAWRGAPRPPGLSAPAGTGLTAPDAARAACTANGDTTGAPPPPPASPSAARGLSLLGDSGGSDAPLCCGLLLASSCACAARLSKLLRALDGAVAVAAAAAAALALGAAARSTSARSSCYATAGAAGREDSKGKLRTGE